jgi:hypothetical protein
MFTRAGHRTISATRLLFTNAEHIFQNPFQYYAPIYAYVSQNRHFSQCFPQRNLWSHIHFSSWCGLHNALLSPSSFHHFNIKLGLLSKKVLGRAIAQAVSRWLPTAAARVQIRV